MFVKTILDEKGPKLIRVSQADSIRDVARLFKLERIGFAVVEDVAHEPVGSISERDIIQAFAEGGDLDALKIADVMTGSLVTVGPEDTVETVQEIMTERRTRHVLVEDDGKLGGIVSIGDVIKHSLDQCRIDTGNMRDYIGGKGYQ